MPAHKGQGPFLTWRVNLAGIKQQARPKIIYAYGENLGSVLKSKTDSSKPEDFFLQKATSVCTCRYCWEILKEDKQGKSNNGGVKKVNIPEGNRAIDSFLQTIAHSLDGGCFTHFLTVWSS
jgi:hypothetical protein